MAGKQQRGQETAEKVLRAALTLSQRQDLSIEKLSEEADVSIGSIYHHFGNLQGVAAALYQEAMASLLRFIIAAVKAHTSVRDKVVAQSRAYLEWTREQPSAARFIHASAYAAYMQQYEGTIRAAKLPLMQELLAQFEPHIRSGELLVLPLPLYEVLLIGPLAELARRWLSGQQELDMDLALQLLPERIWQSVKPEE